MQHYININGDFFEADKPVLKYNNRAFYYGDALFETIRISNGKPQFLKEHIDRLLKGAKIYKMTPGEQMNEAYLTGIINELSRKNGIITDGRVRLTIYRNEGGFYAPEDNSVSFLIESKAMDDNGYVLNNKGFTVDLFSEFNKPKNILSTVKSANAAIYVLAGLFKKEKALDECLLMNDKGHIIESISSNIFAVKNGVLYTSPVSDGCIDGIMRKKIIDIAHANKIAVQEVSILQNILLSSDELFLTNSIRGIQWVGAYKQKRYFNDMSKKLIEKLNASIS
jgi:branched-subunit amino acid aminotransferase/4-amino-4-deoxychorismate lyase